MSDSDPIEISDPDTVGPDGTVRLRRYLPLADRHWFSAECEDQEGCGHAMPLGVAAAIVITGSDNATVRQLAQHLQCSRCGNQQIGIVLRSGPRPA